mmetsp:Transcript_295/g.754  ORF Transcript_295/g.754 Transcript_295/m.754 type:complete len:300 (+) Transcript_295:1498-2397(+)
MAQMSLICACMRAVLLRHVWMSTLSVYSLTLRHASSRRSRRRSSMLRRSGMYLARSLKSVSEVDTLEGGPAGSASSMASPSASSASAASASRGRFISTSLPGRVCSEPRLAFSRSDRCCSANAFDSRTYSPILAHSCSARSRSCCGSPSPPPPPSRPSSCRRSSCASPSSELASLSFCDAYSASWICATDSRRSRSATSASACSRACCSACREAARSAPSPADDAPAAVGPAGACIGWSPSAASSTLCNSPVRGTGVPDMTGPMQLATVSYRPERKPEGAEDIGSRAEIAIARPRPTVL